MEIFCFQITYMLGHVFHCFSLPLLFLFPSFVYTVVIWRRTARRWTPLSMFMMFYLDMSKWCRKHFCQLQTQKSLVKATHWYNHDFSFCVVHMLMDTFCQTQTNWFTKCNTMILWLVQNLLQESEHNYTNKDSKRGKTSHR